MDPAKPPLPIPWNLPFQREAGSQTSTWISESSDGFKTTATRQNATATLTGPSPEVNGPAGTDCAAVTVACGNRSAARSEQFAAKAGRDAKAASASGREPS